MSVQELRSCIQKLSSEIELQKKLLKKLEHDKCLVQRQLNAVLDPLARLPFEISSDIFIRCLPSRPALDLSASGSPPSTPLPILLLNICNAWTTIALSTPDLWSAIDIIFPCAKGFPEALEIWLQRARNRPLFISIRGDLEARGAGVVAAVIWQHGLQLKNLEIWADKFKAVDKDDDEEDDEGHTIDVDVFRGISPGPLPLLEMVTIRGDNRRDFSGPPILQLLKRAPNLRECIFYNVGPVYHLDFESEKMVLPNLRRLRFGPCRGKPNSDDDVLDCLSLPALETLSVSLRYSSVSDLLSFLERSSPPLQELVVADGSELSGLHDLFHLLPALTSFEVWGLDPALITVLADSASLLPNLRNLTIHNPRSSDISDSSWETLRLALSARLNQLQVFRLELDEDHPPPVGTLAWKELVADGMEIYIGTEERNFLVA